MSALPSLGGQCTVCDDYSTTLVIRWNTYRRGSRLSRLVSHFRGVRLLQSCAEHRDRVIGILQSEIREVACASANPDEVYVWVKTRELRRSDAPAH